MCDFLLRCNGFALYDNLRLCYSFDAGFWVLMFCLWGMSLLMGFVVVMLICLGYDECMIYCNNVFLIFW